jgi:hypothetical protein
MRENGEDLVGSSEACNSRLCAADGTGCLGAEHSPYHRYSHQQAEAQQGLVPLRLCCCCLASSCFKQLTAAVATAPQTLTAAAQGVYIHHSIRTLVKQSSAVLRACAGRTILAAVAGTAAGGCMALLTCALKMLQFPLLMLYASSLLPGGMLLQQDSCGFAACAGLACLHCYRWKRHAGPVAACTLRSTAAAVCTMCAMLTLAAMMSCVLANAAGVRHLLHLPQTYTIAVMMERHIQTPLRVTIKCASNHDAAMS